MKHLGGNWKNAPSRASTQAARDSGAYQAGRDQYVSGRDMYINTRDSTAPEIVIAEALAHSVQEYWNDEVKARNLDVRDLIAVQWRGDASLHGHELNFGGNVAGLMGDVSGMVDKFLELSPQRLLLVGPAGSGKTALAILMMLDLLRRRGPGSAVPVMFSLSSWDPRANLRSWIARRIVSEYMPEGEDNRKWRRSVDRLIRQDLIIPILDGLDELAEPAREQVLEAVNSILPGQPLILTCRREEYIKLVERSRILRGAAASVALPLASDAVADYLSRQGQKSTATWQPVIEAINGDPESPIARALSRPLAVSLLAAAYGTPDSNPGQLLDRMRFPTVGSIHLNLYAEVLNVYKRQMHLSIDRRAWNPDRATVWLANLARHLSEYQIYDIVVWELAHAVSRSQRLFIAAFFALAGGVAAVFLRPLVGGLAGGLTVGMAVGFAASLIRPGKEGAKARLPVSSGKAGGGFIRGNGPLHTAVFAGLTGLLMSLLANFVLQKFVHGYAAYYACMAALVAGTPIGIPGWQPMITFLEVNSAKGPRRQLIEERRINLLFAMVSLGALAAAVWLLGWIYGGLVVGFLLGASASFVIEKLSMAWWSFSIARIMLAATGEFPWRLMAFIEDSYSYGVLRRVGGVYQFRHAELQDFLSNQ